MLLPQPAVASMAWCPNLEGPCALYYILSGATIQYGMTCVLSAGVAGPAVVAELCSATLVMARSIIRSNAHDHLSVVGAHWFMHMSSIAVWGVIASTRQRAVLLI